MDFLVGEGGALTVILSISVGRCQTREGRKHPLRSAAGLLSLSGRAAEDSRKMTPLCSSPPGRQEAGACRSARAPANLVDSAWLMPQKAAAGCR